MSIARWLACLPVVVLGKLITIAFAPVAAWLSMPGDEGEAARIEWEYAQEVRRDSPLMAELSDALGLSEETLDNLFKVAAGL